MKNHKTQKGFTLIELLVVIAIIAILAVVVVLTLNPAELLRQARDSNRISDFATLKSALSLYSTDVATTTPMYGQTGCTGNGTDTLYTADLTPASSTGAATSLLSATYEGTSSWGFVAGYATNVTTTASRAITCAGWIPVNLNAISSGAPIATLPIDPVNSGANMYMYAATSTAFKLATQMESVKYGGANSSANVETGDGGNSTITYEQGTNLTGL